MPKLDEILADAGKSFGVRRIYGEPYEKNGVTVIPAARVFGGAGGGGATEMTATDSPEAVTTPATGSGVGFGMSGRPVGAFVIKGNEVKWLPAIDVNRLMFGFQVVLIVFFLVRRSIAKTHAKVALQAAAQHA